MKKTLKYCIFTVVVMVLYTVGGLYLYYETDDCMVYAIGDRYSNDARTNSMGDSSTWHIVSVYIPKSVACRYPLTITEYDSINTFCKYAQIPWCPVRWALLKWKYKCYYSAGCVLSVVSYDDAIKMISDEKLTVIQREDQVWL